MTTQQNICAKCGAQSESWLMQTKRYHSGLCPHHADAEWTERWLAKVAEARKAGDDDKLRKLNDARHRRVMAGRSVQVPPA